MSSQDIKIELEKMKTEIGIYKKIAGFLSGGALIFSTAVFGWTLAIADEYAQVKSEVKTCNDNFKTQEEKYNDKFKTQEEKNHESSSKMANLDTSIQVMGAHMEGVVKTTEEIRGLLEGLINSSKKGDK